MNKDDFPKLRWASWLTRISGARRLAILLTLLLIPTVLSAQTPDFIWAKRAGGADSDGCRGLAVDRNGSSYLTGWFSGTATFGGTTVNGVATSDIYVAKYDSSGNVLWVSHVGGGTYNEGDGIGVDKSGNSYVIGGFFGPFFFCSNTLTTP